MGAFAAGMHTAVFDGRSAFCRTMSVAVGTEASSSLHVMAARPDDVTHPRCHADRGTRFRQGRRPREELSGVTEPLWSDWADHHPPRRRTGPPCRVGLFRRLPGPEECCPDECSGKVVLKVVLKKVVLNLSRVTFSGWPPTSVARSSSRKCVPRRVERGSYGGGLVRRWARTRVGRATRGDRTGRTGPVRQQFGQLRSPPPRSSRDFYSTGAWTPALRSGRSRSPP